MNTEPAALYLPEGETQMEYEKHITGPAWHTLTSDNGTPLCRCGGVLTYNSRKADVHTYAVTVENGELVGHMGSLKIWDADDDGPPWLQCQQCETRTPVTGLDDLR